MITVSLCMIARNEERVLARCLDSVAGIADEIVIVDTGSTDATKEIARRYTERVLDFAWIDDFAAARNFAFDYARMDYILWLDADDVLLEQDRAGVANLKKTLDPAVDSVSMYYNVAFDPTGGVAFRYRRNRLVRRASGFRWHGAVHEVMHVSGKVQSADLAVTHVPDAAHHDSERNIRIYDRMLASGRRLTARDRFYYANECREHGRHREALTHYRIFLESGDGWVEDNIAACGYLADCHGALGEHRAALGAALRAFTYERPRAEACCRVGFFFMQLSDWESAEFWYTLATRLERPRNDWGYATEACWTWLPELQLCVCCDRLGRLDDAWAHNEAARRHQPKNSQILANREYLRTAMARWPSPPPLES